MDSKTNVEHHQHDKSCCQTKKLGGNVYTLCPSQLTSKSKVPPSPIKSVFKGMLLLVFSPLIIGLICFITVLMVFGPKALRQFIISKFIPKAMSRVADQYKDVRKTLLSSDTISNCKVLDLGSGGGAYMPLLSSASKIIALEPVKKMHPTIRNVAKEAGIVVDETTLENVNEEEKYDPSSSSQLEIWACGIEEYIETHPEAKHTFDWVILGNVLCEVPSQASTLKNVDKLLKIGGRVYFSEHVGYAKGTVMRYIQDFLNPWWRTVSGGCNCNRDTTQELEKMKHHWDIVSWDYSGAQIGQGPPLIGPFHLGIALKTSSGKDE